MSAFSERLKALRVDRCCKVSDIAKAVGISERAYHFYEADKREPTLSKLISLADFFDVSLDYLVGRKEKP